MLPGNFYVLFETPVLGLGKSICFFRFPLLESDSYLGASPGPEPWVRNTQQTREGITRHVIRPYGRSRV